MLKYFFMWNGETAFVWLPELFIHSLRHFTVVNRSQIKYLHYKHWSCDTCVNLLLASLSVSLYVVGSNVMKSIHGVGELMTQVVLRGGGFLPTTPTHQPEGDVVKTQIEPEREDIMVMDTKLKIIEILQVDHNKTASSLKPRLIIFVCIVTWCLFVCFFVGLFFGCSSF